MNLLNIPGAWFETTGKLNSWTFKTGQIKEAMNVHLQVYRPICPGDRMISLPGK